MAPLRVLSALVRTRAARVLIATPGSHLKYASIIKIHDSLENSISSLSLNNNNDDNARLRVPCRFFSNDKDNEKDEKNMDSKDDEKEKILESVQDSIISGGNNNNNDDDDDNSDDDDKMNMKDNKQEELTEIEKSLRSKAAHENHDARADATDDPFGVDYQDGKNRLGPTLPPKYERDRVTGKMTGEIEMELTEEERRLLKMSDQEAERLALNRLLKKKFDSSSSSKDEYLQKLGQLVRQEDAALNPFGRKPSSVQTTGNENDEDGIPLSRKEYKSFSRFMKKEHDQQITHQDIAVSETENKDDVDYYEDDAAEKQEKTPVVSSTDDTFPHERNVDPDLDLAWVAAAQARRRNDNDDEEDDPFADLMPSDFSTTNRVNRKRARLIPPSLLHHNNINLLRRYTTPGGQIMNRVQSRLGAKDQRKVSKLIRRARALGLIPYRGQYKVENHGHLHEANLQQDLDWEVELKQRGLYVAPKQQKENKK